MKMQPKPIVALASGAVLLLSAFCQSAHAQTVIDPTETVTLADENGNNTGPTAITVTYEVTQDTTVGDPGFGEYDYTYIVGNPAGDTANIANFSISFDASVSGAVVSGPTGAHVNQNNGANGITWFFSGGTAITPGHSSGTLEFFSDFAPIPGDANGSGTGDAWGSEPNGSEVPVPNVVPEPATTTLLVMSPLLLLAFRRNLLKKA
jgi:hypothetical protein